MHSFATMIKQEENKTEAGERERLADMDAHTSAWWKRSSVVFSSPSPLGNQQGKHRKWGRETWMRKWIGTKNIHDHQQTLSEWVTVMSPLPVPQTMPGEYQSLGTFINTKPLNRFMWMLKRLYNVELWNEFKRSAGSRYKSGACSCLCGTCCCYLVNRCML